jgi:uncharacterized protein (DUF488 family)
MPRAWHRLTFARLRDVTRTDPPPDRSSDVVLWTIGHSTTPVERLLHALRTNGVRTLADVRAFPASRRHPQYGRAALEATLAAAGLRYAWLGDTLGGRRSAARDSRNVALRVEGFRAYADHMATAEFRRGVDDLLALAREAPTAFLCAEALWWRCHRGLLADHLVLVRGARVLHVLGDAPPREHRPRAEARVVSAAEGDHLVYDVVPDEPLFGATG